MSGFGIPKSAGGALKPIVKYDARAGRMSRSDRTQVNGEWTSQDVDITKSAVFVADFAKAQKGWLAFVKGLGLQKVTAPVGEAMPPRPADVGADGKPLYKAGFVMDVILHQSCAGADGGAPRELASSAQVAIDGFGKVLDVYKAAPEAKAGKLPVVQLVDSIAVKSGSSTNYEPVLKIVSWVDRPAILDTQAAEAPSPAPAAAEAFTPPPAPAPAAAPTAYDFG